METEILLETERLWLRPLSILQMEHWLNDLPALEAEWRIDYRGEPLQGIFRTIVQSQLAKMKAEPERALAHTFWLLIRKSDRAAIGSADFKNPPDKQGRVEIGYGLDPAFWNHGYMTEAVAAMTRWALERPDIRAVTAETEKDNPASMRVLEKAGFRLSHETESAFWWLCGLDEIQ